MAAEKVNQTKTCPSCQKDIPAGAKKCPFCQSDLRNWFKRHPILTAILGLLILFFLIGATGSSKKETVPTSPSGEQKQETQKSVEQREETPKPKEWVTVITVSGNSNKRTDVFTLQGGKTRLTYDVKGSMVVVSVYVLPEGYSLEEKGGFPEVTVSEPGTDTTFLTKKAGNYHLDIKSANATWSVKIEEER